MDKNYYAAKKIAKMRHFCAEGIAPDYIASMQEMEGDLFPAEIPELADYCITVLTRTARDDQLDGLYKDLLGVHDGVSTDGYAQLPATIGQAALNKANTVELGNGKTLALTPSLAFDAGFTVAYQHGGPSSEASVTSILVDSCLNNKLTSGACYAFGMLYGARAAKAR